eukprot:TRINITY_DN1775_c0_g1_i1.p4 TRINITY_DN1775_c0_g1~~TRINITY_DN1775_c0_g1_i1.p4  ORF type:complete len:100 (-),score=24.88 TRINITY_DN1775_c0_g1_i1:66-365(-)
MVIRHAQAASCGQCEQQPERRAACPPLPAPPPADDLIRAIHGDIAYAHQKLAEPELLQAGQALRDLDTGTAAAATPEAAATTPAPAAEDRAADEDGGDV